MKANQFLIHIFLIGALLLTGCGSDLRVGALQTESQSVEMGDVDAVRVEIYIGFGDLDVIGGAKKLLEADFNYNVARLKPEVVYRGGMLVVRQPEARGLPNFRDTMDFYNKWSLHLNDDVHMDLVVNMGAGVSNLQLAGLSLNRLNVNLGAGVSTIDLSGNWMHDLDVTIDTGVADITVRLPREIGTRVNVKSGPHTIEATGLKQDGNVYTNTNYGDSDVTLQVEIESGIGQIILEVEGITTASE